MGKQVFILNCPSGDVGVAKIISNGKNSVLTLSLNKKIPEIKKCHILNDGKIIKTFDTWRNKRSFNFTSDIKLDGVFLTSDNNDNILAWSGDNKPINESKVKTVMPDETNFENFFGGGFEWRRIRGNFIIHNYSILHYVISDSNVYRTINRAGYYTCGVKKEENITFIAIAIPVINGEPPYKNINADSYIIKSGKNSFSALCMGIDETGEFFLSI